MISADTYCVKPGKIFGAIIRVTDSIWVSGFNALMALVTGDWDTMWSELANIAGFFGDIIRVQ